LAGFSFKSAQSFFINLLGSYLIVHSLALELNGPEGLRVATRNVLGHVVRDRFSVAAALRFVQLKSASTIVDAVTGVDERVDRVAGNTNLGATGGSSRVGGKLLIVEERRDSVVSAVALGACERVEVDDAAVTAVQGNEVRRMMRNVPVNQKTYPASIWVAGVIGLATVAAMNMALARTEMIWSCQNVNFATGSK